MSNQPRCTCGVPALSIESLKPGPNQGRWFWKCSRSMCSYFKWDTSASPYTTHPAKAYAIAAASRNIHSNKWALQHMEVQREKGPSLRESPMKTIVEFSLLSEDQICIKTTHNDTLLPVLRSIPDGEWDDENERWIIPATVTSYENAIQRMPTETPNLNLKVQPLLPGIVAHMKDKMSEKSMIDQNDREFDTRVSRVKNSSLWNLLRDYQKQGVRTGVVMKGRVLFGDDRGSGKTVQGLALALAYEDKWPALVICPASLCLTWKDEILRWLELKEEEVHVTLRSSDVLGKGNLRKRSKPADAGLHIPKKRNANLELPTRFKKDIPQVSDSESESESGSNQDSINAVKFYIMNYDIAARYAKEIEDMDFQIILCDESSQLKNRMSNRPRALTRVFHRTKHLIMISNTPEDARPVDIQTQLHALQSVKFPDFIRFSQRYCKPTHHVFGWDYSGTSNGAELRHLMIKTVLIRREREFIDYELPERARQIIYTEIPYKSRIQLKKTKKAMKKAEGNEAPEDQDNIVDPEMLECGKAKVEPIISYIDDVLANNDPPSIIVFAYNNEVLDSIQEKLKEKKITYGRVDKDTEFSIKQTKCDGFNANKRKKMVNTILWNIHAADPNLKFEGVNIAIFAEISNNPSELIKAEDLAYGNQSCVSFQTKYFIGVDTIDERVWENIQNFVMIYESGVKAVEDTEIRNGLEDPQEIDENSTDNSDRPATPERILLTRDSSDSSEDEDEITFEPGPTYGEIMAKQLKKTTKKTTKKSKRKSRA
ncbi:GRF-type zinc finger transcription factor [Phycomyces blakesleeanus]